MNLRVVTVFSTSNSAIDKLVCRVNL
jgi:hypothetical protein